MECLLHTTTPTLPQQMSRDWYGAAVEPPVSFSFELTGETLIFRASCPAPALINPAARPGAFCPELWKYDTAEFFLASPVTGHYLEFNLCPNGAWWAQAFSAPRVAADTPAPEGVLTEAAYTPTGWSTQAAIPLTELGRLGLDPRHCLLAAAAIVHSPDYLFLTTADNQTGEPDFHRPACWPPAKLV